VKENEFEKNLLDMSNQDRFVFSEINDFRSKKAQTRLISENQLIDLRVKIKKNLADCKLYKRDDIINNPSTDEFNIYVNYKKKYNDYYSRRIK